MKAAWDWALPRASDGERAALVSFAADLGFDTLVLGAPEPDLVEEAHKRALRVVAVLSPTVDSRFADMNPDAVQRMQPYENGMLDAIRSQPNETSQRTAHRWFPLVQGGELLCYEHDESRSLLSRRIEELLATADGIALDGFGFRNHYACFCSHCVSQHTGDPETIASYSERSLVEISRFITEHAKRVQPEAIVMNHVWPPFNPNPYYGCNLFLDYCTQTISWFYRPMWDLSRVRLEAQLHASVERRDRNRFVPFIGLYADPYQTRTPERVAAELEIAREYGAGSFVLCTLEAPWKSSRIRRVVQAACRG